MATLYLPDLQDAQVEPLLGIGLVLPDLPGSEDVRFAVMLVAHEVFALPADRLRALCAVVISLAVPADRASPAPWTRQWREGGHIQSVRPEFE